MEARGSLHVNSWKSMQVGGMAANGSQRDVHDICGSSWWKPVEVYMEVIACSVVPEVRLKPGNA